MYCSISVDGNRSSSSNPLARRPQPPPQDGQGKGQNYNNLIFIFQIVAYLTKIQWLFVHKNSMMERKGLGGGESPRCSGC